MKIRLFMKATIVIFILGMSQQVAAAVINYDESVDGDLSDFSSGTFIGELGAGISTISGTTSVSTYPMPSDFDSFRFIIPDNHQITAFSIRGELYPNTEGSGVGMGLRVYNPEDERIRSTNIGTYDGRHRNLLNGVDMGSLIPGMYRVQQDSFSGRGSIEYLYTIEVTAVPIPSALWLMGSGFLTLVGFARNIRKQNQK